MALCVCPSGNCQPKKLQLGVMPNPCVGVETGEHNGSDFHAADAAFAIEFHCQRLCGKFIVGNVRKDRTRVDVDTMSARGLDRGNASLVDSTREVRGLSDA